MKIALKNRIANYLREWKGLNSDKWIHKGEIEDKARELGYLSETSGRRIRELCEEGILISRPAGKSTEYKYAL